jgi:hypothetical protein
MDNISFNIRTDKEALAKESLLLALRVCCDYDPEGKKSHNKLFYKVYPRIGLVFSWHKHEGFKNVTRLSDEYTDQPGLFPDVVEDAFKWVATQDPCDYTPAACELSEHQYEDEHHDSWDDDYNDSDVSTDDAWRIYTGDWGHVAGEHWCCAIKPVYAWYGK